MKKSTIYQYLEKLSVEKGNPLRVHVIETDCLELAQQLVRDGISDVTVLNMANNKSVGGDYSTSKGGQEESIIRRSDLLASLTDMGITQTGTILNPYKYVVKDALSISGDSSSCGFGDLACIFSKDIWVNLKDSTLFQVNILSSAAINLLEVGHLSGKVYIALTVLKMVNQLRVAKYHNQKNVILGAFGCGAYQNNPIIIAQLYHNVLNMPEFVEYFDNIYFAILPETKLETNSKLSVFKSQFENRSPQLINEEIGSLKLEDFEGGSDPAYLIKRFNELSKITSHLELYFNLKTILESEIIQSSFQKKVFPERLNFIKLAVELLEQYQCDEEKLLKFTDGLKKIPNYQNVAYISSPMFGTQKYYLLNKIDNTLEQYKRDCKAPIEFITVDSAVKGDLTRKEGLIETSCDLKLLTTNDDVTKLQILVAQDPEIINRVLYYIEESCYLIHHAVSGLNLKAITLLIDIGANIESVNSKGYTPLIDMVVYYFSDYLSGADGDYNPDDTKKLIDCLNYLVNSCGANINHKFEVSNSDGITRTYDNVAQFIKDYIYPELEENFDIYDYNECFNESIRDEILSILQTTPRQSASIRKPR